MAELTCCPRDRERSAEIDRLRAELIKAQQARDFINENWVKEKAALDEICSQRDRLRAELAAISVERDRLVSTGHSVAEERDELRAELTAAQTIATRERAEADVQIERRIEVEAELAAANARTGKCGMEGHNKSCYYCGEPCNSLVGNPSRWPVALCHADEPGVVKWHHTGCVMERLAELAFMRGHGIVQDNERLKAELAALQAEHDSVVLGWQNHDRTQKAELAEAKARIAELEAWKATCQEVDCYRVSEARAERAEAELKAMREALSFYADERNWHTAPHYYSAAVRDCGTKARAALAPPPAGEKS